MVSTLKTPKDTQTTNIPYTRQLGHNNDYHP